MKYINFKRYKFSTVLKKISTLRYNFLKIFKSIGFKRYDIKKFYKYFDLNKFNFYKIFKYFNLFLNKISNLKKINILRSKFLILHLPLSIIFFGFLYLFIPTFYNYDKASIENIICKDNNIQCIIKGKIKYRFYPTPRLKIKDLVVNEFSKKKLTLLNVYENQPLTLNRSLLLIHHLG